MHRIPAFALLAVLTLPALAHGAPGSRARASAHAADEALHRRMLGAWEIVWPSVAPQREIKLITPTHFSWTTFDPATHHVSATGGGAHTLLDGVYCEQVDFALGGIESAAGQVLCFRVEIHGDSLVQSRAPGADGMSIREVWRRLR